MSWFNPQYTAFGHYHAFEDEITKAEDDSIVPYILIIVMMLNYILAMKLLNLNKV